MTTVSFVTLFDPFSIGIRIMANAVRQAGHDSRIIYFKLPREYEKEAPHRNPVGYEILRDGRMFGFVRDQEPWTDREEDLLLERLGRENPDNYLKDCDLPVFICSHYMKEIYRQIRASYPHVSTIP